MRGLSVNTDEAIPLLDLIVKNPGDDLPELGRETVLGLQQAFAEMDESLEKSEEGRRSQADNPIRKARVMLDDLVGSLDRLEEQFEQVSLGEFALLRVFPAR